ncbi:MAG TPA: hypothetical protein ENI94_07795, partial [Gammaproteobacteria bacterium]|nr:hypothetical protein [Gammaproteobacteria bacterium]
MKDKSFRARCFVIQPFGKKPTDNKNSPTVDNDRVFEGLKTLERIQPSFRLEIYRGDTEKVRRENLHSHVSDCIKTSHFCIADLTGQNPNVLYETGVARGYGKKVIIICQNKKDIPSDLEGSIFVEYTPENIDSLPSDVQPHFGRVRKIIEEAKEHGDLGRVRYLPNRKEGLIKSKIAKAENKIDILQTNLCVLDTGFKDDVKKALDKNESLQVRILTLDPQSIFVNHRGHQLDLDIKDFRQELGDAIDNVKKYYSGYEDRVRIKIYDDFPVQITFCFDQEIISCVVSSTGKSRDNCAFIVPENMPGAHS